MTCAKKTVLAVVQDADGNVLGWGSNACDAPQKACPRAPGEGYEKCVSICKQPSHAEVSAVINALKYAFPMQWPDALVRVTFESDGPDWTLLVSDNGVGKVEADGPPLVGGLGTAIIKALVKQLGADMTVLPTPAGLCLSITHRSPPAVLPGDLAAYLDDIERDMLLRALEQHRFNRTAAGASLGLSLRQMRYRMARLGVGAADNEGD